MRRLLTILGLSLLCLLPLAGQATPDVLRVAAGHQPMPALQALVDRYQRETGNKVLLIEGSSATLADEIAGGTPYDLFFADDGASATRLHNGGLGEPPQTYACGAPAPQYLVLVRGARRELAQRFLDYLRVQPDSLLQRATAKGCD